jgi:hypothetical protein
MKTFLVAVLYTLSFVVANAEDKKVEEEQRELGRRGYAAEIRIADAVAEFNNRVKGLEGAKTEHPLTEAEVLAALIISEPRGRLRTEHEDKDWTEFAKKKVLPRGAYLMLQGGEIFDNPFGPGSSEVKMWSILIVFGLGKNPPTKYVWDPDIHLVQLPVRYQVLGFGDY